MPQSDEDAIRDLEHQLQCRVGRARSRRLGGLARRRCAVHHRQRRLDHERDGFRDLMARLHGTNGPFRTSTRKTPEMQVTFLAPDIAILHSRFWIDGEVHARRAQPAVARERRHPRRAQDRRPLAHRRDAEHRCPQGPAALSGATTGGTIVLFSLTMSPAVSAPALFGAPPPSFRRPVREKCWENSGTAKTCRENGWRRGVAALMLMTACNHNNGVGDGEKSESGKQVQESRKEKGWREEDKADRQDRKEDCKENGKKDSEEGCKTRQSAGREESQRRDAKPQGRATQKGRPENSRATNDPADEGRAQTDCAQKARTDCGPGARSKATAGCPHERAAPATREPDAPDRQRIQGRGRYAGGCRTAASPPRSGSQQRH